MEFPVSFQQFWQTAVHYPELPLSSPNTAEMVGNFIPVLPKKPVIARYMILNNTAQQSHQQSEFSQIRKVLSGRKQDDLFAITCLQNKIAHSP